MEFHKIYRPITATPFKKNDAYMEFEPCDALKPYIRCFWGSEKPYIQKESEKSEKTLVTPDTCMDIIFRVDFTDNRISNGFCGIDNRSFVSADHFESGKRVSTFAIRFYAWSGKNYKSIWNYQKGR